MAQVLKAEQNEVIDIQTADANLVERGQELPSLEVPMPRTVTTEAGSVRNSVCEAL